MGCDHPLVDKVELHVQPDPQHLTCVPLEDGDLVDRVVGAHDQYREGIHVGEANAVCLGHGLDEAIQRAVASDETG